MSKPASKAPKLTGAVLLGIREILAAQPSTRAAILGYLNEYTNFIESVDEPYEIESRLEQLMNQPSANRGVLLEGLAAAVAEIKNLREKLKDAHDAGYGTDYLDGAARLRSIVKKAEANAVVARSDSYYDQVIKRLQEFLEEARVDKRRADRELESTRDTMMRFNTQKRKYKKVLKELKLMLKTMGSPEAAKGLDTIEEVLRHQNRLPTEWTGETCDRCCREQRIGWAVSDECWNRVVPGKHSMDVLCLECFFEIADEGGHNVRLEDFVYMAVATDMGLYRPTFINDDLRCLVCGTACVLDGCI